MIKEVKISFILIFTLAIGCLFSSCTTSDHTDQSKEKHFEGIDIVFFPGGEKDGPFSGVVYNGARAAEKDLGVNVEYMWSSWDTEKMTSQFKEAIEKDPDAIAIMGHPGETILTPLIDEAQRNGIIVTILNVDLPEAREKYKEKGMGYVGQNVLESGIMLAKGSVRKFNMKPGDEAIIFGLLSEKGRGERTEGCIRGLEEEGIKIHYKEFSKEVNADSTGEEAKKFFEETINEFPESKLIMVDHGEVTANTPDILKKIGKKPSEIKIAGFDLSKKTVQGIQSGYIGIVHDQQPYLQGYLPILQAAMTKKYGFAGLYIDTGVGLIDDSNVALAAELAKKGIR